MASLNSTSPLIARYYRERAEQMRISAKLFFDQSAKEAMLQVAAAYVALAKLEMSLERDLELKIKSDEMIWRSKIEIARNWRWAG
jgi:hypothetical protein